MRWFTTVLIALAAGFAGAALWDFSGFGPDRTREALLANPEILPEAMDELRRRDVASRLEPFRQELEAPFPGAVLGNPDGEITLVEFTDYACGFCRTSLPVVNRLIEENPDLRVVVREYPILSAGSADAARMALAAAQQGKYEAFHNAMFEQGSITRDNIEAAALAADMDLDLARNEIQAGQFESQLQNNVFLAQNLGITGTPAWIVGNQVMAGAVGEDVIAEAIEEARDS